MRLGLGLSICLPSTFGGGGAVFDPVTLNMDGWWRIPFASFPHDGVASAGSSGDSAKRLASIGTDPAVGSNLNGMATFDFDGTNDAVRPDVDYNFSNFATTTAHSGWALVNIDAIATNTTPGNNAAIWGTNGTLVSGVELKDAAGTRTVRYITMVAGVPKVAETSFAIGSWQLVQWKTNGTNNYVRVNGGAWASTASGTADSVGGEFFLGKWIAYSNGRLADLGVTKQVLADAAFDNVLAYARARYGEALL